VTVADVEHAAGVRFDRRVQVAHRASLAYLLRGAAAGRPDPAAVAA